MNQVLRLTGRGCSLEKAASGGEYLGYFNGIASAECKDADDDVIVQDGMDWDPFMKSGRVTLHHPPGVMNWVGIPLDLERTTVDSVAAHRLRTGILDTKLGKAVFELGEALQKAGGARKLGYSVDGFTRPDWREGNVVRKSVVQHVAIDGDPRNPMTWGSIEPLVRALADPTVLETIWKSYVGTVQQGGSFSSASGSELAPLVPQSLRGVTGKTKTAVYNAIDDMGPEGVLAARFIKAMANNPDEIYFDHFRKAWGLGTKTARKFLAKATSGGK